MSAARAAVLVRTYSWDEYAFRSATRIWNRCEGLDFYVLADETNTGPLDVRPFRKLAHTTSDFESIGLPCAAPPPAAPLWWNCDYGLYDAAIRLPDYDYYFLLENDVAVNLDLRPLVERLAKDGLDCVTCFHHKPITAGWAFAASCGDLPYARKTWTQLCIMLVSRAAALHLLSERQKLARRHAESGLSAWPFCEGFFSSAIVDAGCATAPLRNYADLTHFAAESLYLEGDPRAAVPGSFCHSVLDPDRFWRKFAGRALNTMLVTGAYDDLRQVRDTLTRIGRTRHEGWMIAAAAGNLALDRPARQSSRSNWSRRARADNPDANAIDARGGNCGVLTGSYGFHTELEDSPWWSVELDRCRAVGMVRLYNGLQASGRARRLSVQVSTDGVLWQQAYRKADDAVFSGNDDPLVCRFARPLMARHVRVRIDGPGVLSLAEVEVYGPDMGEPPDG